MSILAIIPARAGSKRLPRKNVADLNGKPLVYWTLLAALRTPELDEIICTTDDAEVVAVGDDLDASYPYLLGVDRFFMHARDPQLATDEASTVDVIADAVAQARSQPDLIVYLEPTTPFRGPHDIQACLRLMDYDVDAVVSVTRFDFPPQHGLWVSEDGVATEFFPSHLLARGDTRTQSQRPVYHPNGGVYVVRAEHFERHRSLFSGRLRAHVMQPEYSVDVDEYRDLERARWLVQTGRVALWP